MKKVIKKILTIEEETNTKVKTEVFKLYAKDANEGPRLFGEVEINKNDSI